MTTIVKAKSSAEILGLVPHLLGFEPHNSLVFVTFIGKRSAAVMRINLPPSQSAAVLKRVVGQTLGTLCKVRGIEAIMPVVFTDEPFGLHAPRRQLAEIADSRVRSMGFELRDSICRAGDGWASYLDREVPPGGYPLSDIVAPSGLLPLAAPAAVICDAPEPQREAIAAEVARLRSLLRVDPEHPELAPLDDLLMFFDDALDWDDGERNALAPVLIAVLQAPPWRDHAMIQWSTSLEWADLRWDMPEQLADRMMGNGPRPSNERIHAGIDLVGRLVALAVDELRPPLLCMLGWLHWSLGHASNAGECVERALDINPEYGMAQLLYGFFASGTLPEWVFEPPPAADRMQPLD